MVQVKKIVIILAISWGFVGCDSLFNKSETHIQKKDQYVRLAKRYEQVIKKYEPLYFQKKQKGGTEENIMAVSKKEYKKFITKYNFNEKKIENYRIEILQLAASYGFKNFTLKKYFYINPITGEFLDKEYYNMAFAYIKYVKEKSAPTFKKIDNINKRITVLTKKYNALMKKAKTSQEVYKLQEEYLKKLDKLDNSYR